MNCQCLEIHFPSGLDLSKDTEYASQAALWGIEVSISICLLCLTWWGEYGFWMPHFVWYNKILSYQGLPDLGEIYPLGGSADRLGLVDPDTGECLPAAMLPYCGRTLLEGLIRDVQVLRSLLLSCKGISYSFVATFLEKERCSCNVFP